MTHTLRFPGSLLIPFAALTLSGCAGWFGSTEQEPPTTPMLDGTVWQVEDVDKGGIIDNSMITVAFDDGRVIGYTGCNRYFGSYETVGESITVREIASTLKACTPAIAAQEQRFLQALSGATSYRLESGTWLVIADDRERDRLKMIEIDADPTATGAANEQPQDTATIRSVIHFDCEDLGPVDLDFVGPETISLTIGDQSEILQRQVSASGARYIGDTLEFWNQGREAMLSMDGTTYTCRRGD